MRLGVICLFVGACGFETATPTQPGIADASFSQPVDARPDAAAPSDTPPAKVCAAAYQTVANTGTQSKYRRVQVQTQWLVAKADCETDGGHLVVPETKAEAMAVHAFVDPLDTSPYFWAGVKDPERDGTWVTVMGTPFTIPGWGAGDPDQRAGEIYAIVYSNGNFYDWFDDGEQEYACECEP
jgi:hypothetical protein